MTLIYVNKPMNTCSGGKPLLVTGENFDSVTRAILTVDVYYKGVFLAKYKYVSLNKHMFNYDIVSIYVS